jgi:hypothetical protein
VPENDNTHERGLSEDDQYARIIAKAKNDLYLTDDSRVEVVKREGIETKINHLGFRDTF